MKLNIKTEINSTETYKKLFAKLENPDVTYQNFVKNLAKYHFQVKAVMQDILECRDSMERLNSLNEKGRSLLTMLREELDNLDLYGRESGDQKYVAELESQRHLLADLLREFKEANISTLFAIEKAQRDELLKSRIEGEESVLRNRKKQVNRDGLLKMTTGVTDQLLSISRQLADTTQRSQATLDSLVSSSSTVHGTQSELENTAGTISQSSKLLNKYGHPKVLAFVSHGGMLSLSEAAHCGKPLLAMPFFGDQFSNSAAIRASGLGSMMSFDRLNADNLAEQIRKLTSLEMQKNARKVSKLWHDRPQPVMASAIYWTEYVARHHEAPSSLPSKGKTLFEKMLLDVWASLITILFVIALISYLIFIILQLILVKLLVNLVSRTKVKNE